LSFVLVALLGTGLWGWSHGLTGPYHFDDHVTPLGDPASQSVAAWQRNVGHTLRPVTKLTYAIEADTLPTDTPFTRRVVSLLLHSVSSAVLFLLIGQLAPAIPPLAAALLAGAWFVHPLHADAVLMASGRSVVLSNVFILTAVLALARSRLWIATLSFALACLARETALAAILPLAVLTMSTHEGWRARVRRLTPLIATGALVTLWILTTPRYLQLADYSFFGRPFAQSVIAQVGAVPVGLGLLFQPAALSIDYGIPLPARATDVWFGLGVLLYVSAAAGVVFSVRRSPAVAVGLSLWLAALLPTQSFVPKLDALTNKPLSLALAGLLIAAAPLIAQAVVLVRQWNTRRRFEQSLAFCGAFALIAALTLANAARSELFQSRLRLWHDAAAKSRVNERPHLQYALLLRRDGRSQEAADAVAIAARINPFSSQIAALSAVMRRQEIRR
jgi:hypothetical protein